MRRRSWKYHAAWCPRFTLHLSNSGGKRRKGSMRGGRGQKKGGNVKRKREECGEKSQGMREEGERAKTDERRKRRGRERN